MNKTSPHLRPAVFLDRDGVLNVYLPGDYVKTPAELRLLPGVAAAVRRLNDAGLPVFVISNQQGVAKGLMSEADLSDVDRALKEGLAAEGGARVEQSYYCPHAASERCECRKPRAGLLLQAARDHGLDLSRSVFVGDTETDAQAARAAGVGAFVLVLTGKHRDPAAAADTARFPVAPDHVAADLNGAVAWVLDPKPTTAR
jgi:D-glycero-D-manno-heptose 1,7-bisphosphate phosphatase